jgi:hypothetical protein
LGNRVRRCEAASGIHVASAFRENKIVPDLRVSYQDTSGMISARPFEDTYGK